MKATIGPGQRAFGEIDDESTMYIRDVLQHSIPRLPTPPLVASREHFTRLFAHGLTLLDSSWQTFAPGSETCTSHGTADGIRRAWDYLPSIPLSPSPRLVRHGIGMVPT